MSKQFQNLNDKIIERDKIDTLAQKYTNTTVPVKYRTAIHVLFLDFNLCAVG